MTVNEPRKVTRLRVELVFTPGDDVADDQPVVATFDHDDGLIVELALTLARDELVTTGIAMRREPRIDLSEVRLPLTEYLSMVASHPALTVRGQPRRTRRRRVMDDEFLRSVADAYRAAGNSIDGLTPPRFSATARQKHRWVQLARERGILGDGGPG